MRRHTTAAALLVMLLLVSLASAQTCDEEVFFTTSDGTIEIHHLQTMYNCCCAVDSEVLQDDFWIDVHEYEQLIAGGCDCLCCFDIAIVIAGLAPGDYTLSIIKHTEHGGVELVGTWVVTVTGWCAPSLLTTFVPCSETGMAHEETTWGVIKALYR